jgi:hypothetical protein
VGGVIVIAYLGWVVYGWLRPLTPREVCDRFGQAKTAQDAKKYCTLNLHPALDAIFRQNLPDTDDPFEYTQETEAPPDVGGYFVGIRFHIYVPEARRRVQFDAVLHLIKSDGWKVEDIYFTSMERNPLPGWISLARDYHFLLDQPAAGGQFVNPAQPPGGPPVGAVKAKEWYQNQAVTSVARPAVFGIGRLVSGRGGKWLGGLILAIGAGVAALWRKSRQAR